MSKPQKQECVLAAEPLAEDITPPNTSGQSRIILDVPGDEAPQTAPLLDVASAQAEDVGNDILKDNNPLSASARTQKRVSSRLRFVWMAAIVVLLILLTVIWWYRHQSMRPARLSAANRALVAEVSQRAVLPKDENPAITTVVDAQKANQTFLVNAADGDKVLLYFQSGRAVLYRPSTHQIVNMGPLTQPPARIFIRNGASPAIPTRLIDKLTQSAGFNVVSTDVSPKPTYDKTLVIDLTGNRPDIAARIATLIGGNVSKLPSGESRPDADILVIVGSGAK